MSSRRYRRRRRVPNAERPGGSPFIAREPMAHGGEAQVQATRVPPLRQVPQELHDARIFASVMRRK
ncbi:hypothetical protein [Acetobacter sp. DsW_063]|uniref:hypothetical protein n=1 Tax=Acetobacter sp. DsW_063 TaxID=1514894 RepID=UPI001178520C|nr:hypothetical protein [Acetobacter sp. DsW_063]